MKVAIFTGEQAKRLRDMGRKTRSHGTFRAQRHPSSPRVRAAERINPQYKVVK